MTAILWTDVTNHTPGANLASVPIGAQTDILGFVNGRINVEMFDGEDGFDTKLVRVYLAAHFGSIVLSRGIINTGAITAEGGGGLTRSYAAPMFDMSRGSLGLTSFGQQYLSLIHASAAAAPFVP